MLKKVLFENVNFDFDRYDLGPDAREILKGHAAWLKANPQSKVEVEGHCDERGTREYNLALGAKRAESAKRYLIDLGISPIRCRPLATVKSFLSAGSRMRPAGQRIGARTLS